MREKNTLSTHPSAIESDQTALRPVSIQGYARLAAALGILSIIGGAFGEAYVPSTIIVSGDAAATARNLLSSEDLFRWGFAGYLVEAICDAALTMAFWVLLRPVNRNLAMLMVVFRIISTCGFASAEMMYFGALSTVKATGPLGAFDRDQLNALGYMLLMVSGFGQALFTMFYGIASVIFGWLIYRSGYIPRILGVAMATAGVGFVARTVLLVVAPRYASMVLLAPMILAFLPLTVWLLVKGVDEEKWRAVAAAQQSGLHAA